MRGFRLVLYWFVREEFEENTLINETRSFFFSVLLLLFLSRGYKAKSPANALFSYVRMTSREIESSFCGRPCSETAAHFECHVVRHGGYRGLFRFDAAAFIGQMITGLVVRRIVQRLVFAIGVLI